MDRQLQLRRGSTTLDLTASPYRLQAGSWRSTGGELSFAVIVEATSLTELDRYVSAIRRLLTAASLHSQEYIGDSVYVYTKVCDDLTVTAELGATWQRKTVWGGITGTDDPSIRADKHYTMPIAVTLAVDPSWQRDKPISIMTGSANYTTRSDGGVTGITDALTARRMTWNAGEGFTVRVRWLYTDANVTFFSAASDGHAVNALYLAGDNKLYVYDSAGTSASSAALTATAGDELDLVFLWDPVTPKMGIWVNGVANGTAATCVLSFVLGAELILNPGFETKTGTEDDDATDTFTSWTNGPVDDGAGNRIEATATVQAGSFALKLTGTTTYTYIIQSFAVTPGYTYKATLYARGAGIGTWFVRNLTDETIVLTPVTSTPAGTSYTAQTVYFRVPITYTDTTATLYLLSPTSGVCYYDAVSIKRVTEPATYSIFTPSTSQSLLSCQVWPAALTSAQCAGLYAWGRPEPELPYQVGPTDTKNTNAFLKLHNVPGDSLAPVRLMFSSAAAQDFDQVRVSLRPLKIQTAHLWECEAGVLGTAVGANSNADASAGSQARYTPAATTYAARVTITLCADPNDVAGMIGDYRLYLAGYDSAASAGINILKWRLVTAGEAEAYSDNFSFAVVATRSLLDLGKLSIPAGAWPDESESATTDVHAGSYITLEIASSNTTGGGGGTLDLDAVYLFPREREGIWTGDLDVSGVSAVVDHVSVPWAAVAVSDEVSLEFAKWATWSNEPLMLAPNYGDAGSLVYYAYRDSAEQAFPNDTIICHAFVSPTWEGV